ncbi:hypothetical protein CR513_37526, partial [Mucuna pruriens]
MSRKVKSLLHPYRMCSKTKLMEVVVDDLEQQHKELRGTPNHLPGFTLQQTQSQMPLYGLPPGFTPLVVTDEQQASVDNLQIEEPGVALIRPSLTTNPTLGPKNAQTSPFSTRPFAEKMQEGDKWHLLEERLRVIEGVNHYEFEAADLFLVLDVVIPHKFKVLDFDKYKGSSCPRTHLIMYYKKMSSHAQDDRLRIQTWKNLAKAFLKQYKYNKDMASDCTGPQNMLKHEDENFKEYAQRWREIAIQVQPPIFEKEMVTMFIDTLQSPFYDKVIGNVSSNFSDLVVIEERIEVGIRQGKFTYAKTRSGSGKKPPTFKKKKGEANAIISKIGPQHDKTSPTPPPYLT